MYTAECRGRKREKKREEEIFSWGELMTGKKSSFSSLFCVPVCRKENG